MWSQSSFVNSAVIRFSGSFHCNSIWRHPLCWLVLGLCSLTLNRRFNWNCSSQRDQWLGDFVQCIFTVILHIRFPYFVPTWSFWLCSLTFQSVHSRCPAISFYICSSLRDHLKRRDLDIELYCVTWIDLLDPTFTISFGLFKVWLSCQEPTGCFSM